MSVRATLQYCTPPEGHRRLSHLRTDAAKERSKKYRMLCNRELTGIDLNRREPRGTLL